MTDSVRTASNREMAGDAAAPSIPAPSLLAQRRRNMLERTEERWRPPLFAPASTPLSRATAAIRRFFDLQAGSAWRDLKLELANAAGPLLDVGCGAQPFRPLVPPGIRYIGLDTADAEAHFGYRVPDTLYFSGDRWPIETESVDTLLCTETLEHVLHPEALLSEAYRVLRPGGRLVLTVPFAARWHFIPHDYWRYTPSSLKFLLNGAGFAAVGVFARGNALTVACYKSMALFLPLLFSPISDSTGMRAAGRVLGVCLLPIIVLLAVIGNLSLIAPGGDDCLGYTVIATRR